MDRRLTFKENLDSFMDFIETYGRPPLIDDNEKLYNFGTNTVARIRHNVLPLDSLNMVYERMPILKTIKGYGDLSRYYRSLRNSGELRTKTGEVFLETALQNDRRAASYERKGIISINDYLAFFFKEGETIAKEVWQILCFDAPAVFKEEDINYMMFLKEFTDVPLKNIISNEMNSYCQRFHDGRYPKFDLKEMRSAIDRCFVLLEDKSLSEVIRHCYGLNETNTKISVNKMPEMYGVSKQRIYQWVSDGLRKLNLSFLNPVNNLIVREW